MFGNLGFWEILLIAVVVIVLFGAKRIPDVMKGLGEGIRSFKKGIAGEAEPTDAKPAKKAE
ncbi:MAG: twin-arginine translocase TatA/TatE family subunit [Acidobacteria bacterium]|nr:twin-arginine translocase TatA/TatE family subunit [Acidobacteriota bacterium]